MKREPLIVKTSALKSGLPTIAAISGVTKLATKAVTTAPNAAPMTTATARSITLPRRMKSLNSLIIMLADSMTQAETLHCLVEVPKGSRNKYEWDERLKAIKLE